MAIDKETMLDLIIEAKKTDPETGSFAEWLAEYLVERLPTLTPPNEWISVTEGFPQDGRVVITDGMLVAIDYAKNVRRRAMLGAVTHWMPLPAPPAAKIK